MSVDDASAIATLAELGSADAIAQHLRERGCTGFIGSSSECPVSRYISQETGERLCVTPDYWRDGDGTARHMPDQVTEFVLRFDERFYPDLIEAAS